MNHSLRRLVIAVLALVTLASRAEIRVLMWDERQPQQKQAYSNFLGGAIGDHLASCGGITVRQASLDDPEQGITAAALDDTDVLIIWAHIRKAELKDEKAKLVVDRIKSGRLSMIALHSAHWAKPFVEAMCERTREDAQKMLTEDERGRVQIDCIPAALYKVPKSTDPVTPSFMRGTNAAGGEVLTVRMPGCIFPAYRADGKPSHVTTLLPDHPIAKDIPATFDIPQTEMYSDPFHVPKPDATVFLEKWDRGELFHSGSVWNVGQGRVVYFRPGHETYPIYLQPIPLKIIENMVRWLGAGR